MKEKTYCPALKKEVLISRKGWDHIVNGGSGSKRYVQDVVLRLKLLKQAKYLIKAAKTYSETNADGQTHIALEGKAEKEFGTQNIRIILKRDKHGVISFHSVMKKK